MTVYVVLPERNNTSRCPIPCRCDDDLRLSAAAGKPSECRTGDVFYCLSRVIRAGTLRVTRPRNSSKIRHGSKLLLLSLRAGSKTIFVVAIF